MAFPETVKAFFSRIIRFIISTMAQIPRRLSPPPPSSSSTDIESQEEVVTQRTDNVQSQAVVVPQPTYNHLLHQWKHDSMAVCFESALAIALVSAQIQTQLPVSFHILSFAILLIFLSLVLSSFVGGSFTSAAQVLERALHLLIITTVVFTITIPFPPSFKCVTWALFAITLITVLICKAYSYRSVPTH